MIKFIYVVWCVIAHVNYYKVMPELDTEDKKGVYCKKCRAEFVVSQRVYNKLFEK